VLWDCGIPEKDWKMFCSSITLPLEHYNQGIAYVVDDVLDIVALWDAKYFRPRGFLLRMDMPGEQDYALDSMDIHHFFGFRKHVDNLSPEPKTVGTGTGLFKLKKPKDSHQKHLRKKMFCSTRLILDVIHVLEDPMLASDRGWTNWQQACDNARKKDSESEVVFNNEPWDWANMPQRKDRWPPGKHLYYDRFRGQMIEIDREHELQVSHPSY